jgi:hypothetical protein
MKIKAMATLERRLKDYFVPAALFASFFRFYGPFIMVA